MPVAQAGRFADRRSKNRTEVIPHSPAVLSRKPIKTNSLPQRRCPPASTDASQASASAGFALTKARKTGNIGNLGQSAKRVFTRRLSLRGVLGV